MTQTFPWPVTEEQLILANALDDVMAASAMWVRQKKPGCVTLRRSLLLKLTVRVRATRTCLPIMPSRASPAAGAGS
jgi:hypothetical protein